MRVFAAAGVWMCVFTVIEEQVTHCTVWLLVVTVFDNSRALQHRGRINNKS